jgi:hypothetical protein
MSNKVELFDEQLDAVSGGNITYTWDGEVGTIGMNEYNPYILVDKEAFLEYYNENHATMKDSQILRYLLENGIARKQ